MKRYDFEIVNENAFRIKDMNGHTKAYVARTFYDEATLGYYIPAFPQRKDPKYQTDEWREYKKELHNRIVWPCSSAFAVGCWVVDEHMTNLARVFKCKDQLYIVTSRYKEQSREYDISVKIFPWKDSYYKEFKLFKDLESWSHFDNVHTFYDEYIPDEWR